MIADRNQVEAVWIWKFQASAFKATYGRLAGTTYTKDFLQASGTCAQLFDDVFRGQTTAPIDLEYRWPGDSAAGKLLEASDYESNGRLHFRWDTNKAPAPWRLHKNPSPDTIETIPGDPDHTTESSADAELAKLEQQQLDPYLVAIKLRDEERILHLRAYLGNPSDSLSYSSTTNLPAVLQDAIAAMPNSHACTALYFGGQDSHQPQKPISKLANAVLDALRRSPNVLLIGPPGCGKTVALEELRSVFEHQAVAPQFDASSLHAAWHVAFPRHFKVKSTVFHPSYSYEEFVMGLYPTSVTGEGMSLTLRAGPLLSLAHWASVADNGSLLLIDEFNRGNAASIFGNTLALLDQDQRSDPVTGFAGASIDRTHSEMPFDVASDFETSNGTSVGEQITLPKALYIVAAMNSSDRSVAPLDAALRRRFAIVRAEPDYELLTNHLAINGSSPFAKDRGFEEWTRNDVLQLGVRLLSEINRRIENLIGSDFVLGHSLFWHIAGSETLDTLQSLCAAFDASVTGSLRMTLTDREEILAAVLNGPRPPSEEESLSQPSSDMLCFWMHPTTRLEDLGLPRLRIRSTIDMTPPDAVSALLTVLED